MRSSRAAFTLIELLIVVTLMGTVIITGVAGYQKFNTRQVIVTSGKELLVNLRQAQAKSLSGVKTIPGCQAAQLIGYTITTTPTRNGYTVSETYTSACSTSGTYVIKSVLLPANITFQSAFTFTFLGLSGGVSLPGPSPLTIAFCSKNCVSGSLKYTMTVSKNGLVQDVGGP